MQYSATAAGANVITNNSLGSIFCMATSGVSLTPLSSAVRVRKISLWGPMVANLNPVTVSLEWNNSVGAGAYAIGGPDLRFSDTSIGSNRGAFLSVKPPKGSYASTWLIPTTTAVNVCTLNLPANGVVHLDLEMVFSDAGPAIAFAAVVVVAATASNLYQQPMDGTAVANLKAGGFQSTT